MTLPIKRGSARRLGIRQPAPAPPWLIDMMKQSQFTDWQLAVLDRLYSGGEQAGRMRAIMEEFRAASTIDWGDPTTQPAERLEVAGYRPTAPSPTPWALRRHS